MLEGEEMKCKCHPDSPFLWASNPQDSMFMKDHTFRAKGDTGKSGAQLASDFVEYQRQMGWNPGTIQRLGSRKKELAVTAYKQFGIYSRAHPNIKPTKNKHEL
jgi:hypothetical protein